jgi:hypothetical protein
MLVDKNRTAPDLGRRKVNRNRISRAGLIADGLDMSTVPCLIRDLGLSGAQIRVNAQASIAPGSYHIDLGSRVAYLTYPVWRNGSLMGVAFEESYLINYDLPVRLGFLKNMFVEAKLRQDDLPGNPEPARHPGTSEIWRAALNLV